MSHTAWCHQKQTSPSFYSNLCKSNNVEELQTLSNTCHMSVSPWQRRHNPNPALNIPYCTCPPIVSLITHTHTQRNRVTSSHPLSVVGLLKSLLVLLDQLEWLLQMDCFGEMICEPVWVKVQRKSSTNSLLVPIACALLCVHAPQTMTHRSSLLNEILISVHASFRRSEVKPAGA